MEIAKIYLRKYHIHKSIRENGGYDEIDQEEIQERNSHAVGRPMMAGLVTVMPQSAIRVKAAGTAPGVSAYATKEQLMDGTFAPDTTGY